MKPVPYATVTIVGLGLMGSSLAAALRKISSTCKILGISSPRTLAKARKMGLVDEGFSYDQGTPALEGADLVILCTPIDHIIQLLNNWSVAPPHFKSGCLITDIGSTKVEICRAAEPISKLTPAQFLGSHPMAGSEKTGIEACDPLIFENAPWIVCPTANEPPEMVETFTKFTEMLGCHSFRLSPEEHDSVVARVSHLPQILSTALAGYLGNQESVLKNGLRISGGGLRDMTRLANSSYGVWKPIFDSNHKDILGSLEGFQQYLAKIIENFKNLGLEEAFSQGTGLKQKLLQNNKMLHSQLSEILVDLPDETGILVRVLSRIVEINLNILDIEILKVREGESGTLRIGFKNKSEADAALTQLKRSNFSARPR